MTEARRRALDKYNHSAKRKANSKRYELSTKGGVTRRKYRNNRMQSYRNEFGNHCLYCGTTKRLEFAHIKTTGCTTGAGSGAGQARLTDIARHLCCYVLLCHKHHKQMGGPEGWKDRTILEVALQKS